MVEFVHSFKCYLFLLNENHLDLPFISLAVLVFILTFLHSILLNQILIVSSGQFSCLRSFIVFFIQIFIIHIELYYVSCLKFPIRFCNALSLNFGGYFLHVLFHILLHIFKVNNHDFTSKVMLWYSPCSGSITS